ncbi:MAG: 6-pyruvoyl-tetrahydropterin synthase-related protein [Acidimicrobiales bacterium]
MTRMRRPALAGYRRLTPASVVGFLVVAGVVAFVVWQLQPSLLLSNTTTAGGDTGAHVALPAFMRDHLLPHGRLTGWSPWWYDGYPQFTFYFPLPSLFVVILNLVMPYNIAFKLITVAGSITLPVAAWAFGRLAGMRRPGPVCLAVATLPFLFDRSFTIYGGNLASTMAGEFAFSLSLSVGLVFLGVVARGLDTGKRRALAAVLLAITALCHMVPTIFVVVGAVVLTVMRMNRRPFRRLQWSVTAGLAGAAITGFWVIPFLAGLPYTTNMGFQKVTTYVQSMFPESLWWALALAAVGTAISLARRRRVGIFIAVMAVISGALFVADPVSKLYNARLLPFWVLCVYLLAGVAVAELGILAGEGWARWQAARMDVDDLGQAVLYAMAEVGHAAAARLGRHPELVRTVLEAHPALARDRQDLARDPTEWGRGEREAARMALSLDPGLTRAYELKEAFGQAVALGRDDPALLPAAIDLWVALATGSGLVPFARVARRVQRWRPELAAHVRSGRDPRLFTRARPIASLVTPVLAWVAAAGFVAVPLGLSWMPIKVPTSFVPAWIRWNYSGYQGKPAWPEYHALMTTMGRIGAQHGCGRAMWEYGPELNQLGTPMALMLLPYWTNGCIDSMEGLLFESSATTPYHFINQAEMSKTPSEAMRGLPYGSLDVAAGVRHLQLLGVRYYMAFTPAAERQAAADPALTLLTRSGPWPTTVNGKQLQRTWDIYLVHDSATVTPLATQPVVMTGVGKSGPSWLQASLPWYDNPSRWGVMMAAAGPSSWARVPATDTHPPATPVVPTTVSHVVHHDDRISFDVGRTGAPVLVKTSYFPNWQATGANGPWRVTPNLMVVVPTSHHVSLHYGRTAADWLGWAITGVGLAATVGMAIRRPVPMGPARRRLPSRRSAPVPAGEAGRELVSVGVEQGQEVD